MKNFFSEENGESAETGNTSEQEESFLKTLTAEHQGKLTVKF